MSVALVSDSTHYLPADVAKAIDLHSVSLYTVKDGVERPEVDVTDLTEFYAQLATAKSLPTTSQPSMGDFVATYEPLLAAGNDILSIHITEGISGTIGSATQAAAQLADRYPNNRVLHVDSRAAGGALGLVLIAAANAISQGKDLEESAKIAELAAGSLRNKFLFAVDTLEFLRKGGRIGAAQALIGSALQIKPLLTLDGEMVPVGKVRTTKKARARLVELADELKAEGRTTWCIQHIQSDEAAQELKQQISEIMGCQPQFVSEIGPVIGTHTGPGLIGFGGIPSDLS